MRGFLDKNWSILVLIGILVWASFLRLWQLESIPPGLYPDEAAYANDALNSWETKNFQIFYKANHGREGLFMWLVALSFGIFGSGIWQLRIISALAGILTVFGVYLLVKEIAVKKAELIALSSAFFTAVAFWPLNFSRIGFRASLLPLILAFSFYFLVRALKERKFLDFFLSAMIFGLGFYTYTSFRVAIFIVGAVFIFEFIRYYFEKKPKLLGWKNFKKFYINDGWWKFNFWIAVVILVALPLVFYFYQNSEDFMSRAGGVFVFSHESPLKAFLWSSLKTLGMFNFVGDFNWRHNYSGSPMLFWPMGILFLIGLLISVKEIFISIKINLLKRRRTSLVVICYMLLVIWFIIMLLPAILTFEGIPHALRSIGVIPVIFIFAGIGTWWAFEKLTIFCSKRSIKPIFCFLLFVFFFFIIAYFEYNKYFNDWAKRNETKEAFAQKLTLISRYFNQYPPQINRYLIQTSNGMAQGVIEFLTKPYGKINYVGREDLSLIAPGLDEEAVIIPIDYDENLKKDLEIRFQKNINFKIINGVLVGEVMKRSK